MNLAFVNRMLGMTRGGGEIWDLRVAKELEEMGHDITVYIGKPLTAGVSTPVTEFDTVEIPTPHLRDLAYAAPIVVGGALDDIDSWVFCRRVARELRDTDHDIIHVNSDPRFGRFTSRFNKPVVIKMNGTPHSLWYDYIDPFSSSYDFFERFDAVIATGETTMAIEQRTGIEVHSINPGVDTDQFLPSGSADRNDDPSIIFVGRFVPAKNLPLLIDAFAELQLDHPGVELILVGDGPLRDRIENRVRKRGLEDSVWFPGYVGNDEIHNYYQNSDVFVLSSRNDNHPITLLEAMSSGLPVVAPDIGWIPHIVDNGKNGLVYEVGELKELVEALERLLSDAELREEFGKRGRENAVEGFDWEQRARELETVYEMTLESM